MGVANMEGKVVVSPKYDAIFPYHDGLAAVAVGSKTVRPADDPEHEYTVGGKWGFIDKQGNEVVPLEYDRSLTPSPSPKGEGSEMRER